jgi:hypothetical protein
MLVPGGKTAATLALRRKSRSLGATTPPTTTRMSPPWRFSSSITLQLLDQLRHQHLWPAANMPDPDQVDIVLDRLARRLFGRLE